MANRLTQIATRTGDNGTTGLGDNTRVSKNSLRVHAMGDVDELNSHLGVLLCEDMPPAVRSLLVEIQHQLFNLGGELSIPGFELLKDEAVAALDPLVQKQVLDLLIHLQRERKLAYLFITHNLEVAEAISHRIVFLEKGEKKPLPADWIRG